jgi:hypothetical protein
MWQKLCRSSKRTVTSICKERGSLRPSSPASVQIEEIKILNRIRLKLPCYVFNRRLVLSEDGKWSGLDMVFLEEKAIVCSTVR